MSNNQDESKIRRALLISFTVSVVVLVMAAGFFMFRGKEAPVAIVIESDVMTPIAVPQPSIPALPFTDITAASGVDFVHENGAYGARMLPETMGGGVAFFDYELDGFQDLLLINSSPWPWQPSDTDGYSRLYRGNGDGTFEDVTEAAGLAFAMYGMGVAVGDYDGDGWSDLFITAVGENKLLRNNKGSGFEDVTAAQNVAGTSDAWSTSAAFFDYDNDGDLDLFVCNYVAWSREINESVDYRLTGLGPAYGPPSDFAGTNAYLYRNDRGVFTDVSLEAGIHVQSEATAIPVGKGLAVHPVDLNADGWLDIVVANDTVQNFIYINQQGSGFVESGVSSGLAFDNGGLATGAMGIDAAYYANDERLGIVIGNFANEMSSFYVARTGVFSDDAVVTGIGAASRRALTFGLIFLDVDLDGRLDLLAANGHVEPEINRVQTSQHYAQPLQLFWNCGADCTRQYLLAEAPLEGASFVGRGASYADIDNDGDLDVVVTQVGGPAVLLRNDQNTGNHWVRIELDAQQVIGADVTLRVGDVEQRRVVMPSRSYLSQVELPLSFGLGSAEMVDEVTVTWPDGATQIWRNLGVDRIHWLQRD